MHIKEATEKDIPGILNVLKASLGESSSKKTEEVWRFKHIANPFGKSLVLLAIEEGDVIGVRAFMRWKWQKGENLFSAIRAVDTATHPQHQGKGIFKKLTLRALDLAKEDGCDFIFNTPNKQSLPGYLKMGWKEIGKLKTTIVPTNPINWNKGGFLKRDCEEINSVSKELLSQWNRRMVSGNTLFTPKSNEYLQWRYINNPLQQYRVRIEEDLFLAGYIKYRGNLKELRISEIINSPSGNKKFLKKEVRKWAFESGAHFISFNSSFHHKIFKTGLTGNFGPIFTFKAINSYEENFPFLNSWSYSLGDLELF